ncbi:MAG: hypothetical protein J0M34_02055 [Alphaproteobacteria bacterium]|nr:hypothetical protein [Alphaproteobacteria bacterium]
MKPRPEHLEVLTLKQNRFADPDRVRYRVYQSSSEYIAVIAESALMAIRISGVKDPFKVVRDVPNAYSSIENGMVQIEETSERVPMPTVKPDIKAFVNEVAAKAAEDFITLALADLHHKKISNEGVISRHDGMKSLRDMPEAAPTLVKAPEPVKPAPVIEEPAPMAAVEDTGDRPLSPEEISKLLGDA